MSPIVRTPRPAHLAVIAAAVAGTILPAATADWTNMGGNAGRNGQADVVGPATESLRWETADTSIIAWHPVTHGDSVFVVRQTGFPPGGEPNGSPIFAYDLAEGSERWRADIPFESGDWTTWIAGARDGRVYASRSGNGASVSALLYALDAETGAILWESDDPIDAGAYDGVVFAPDGDLIIASFRDIWRIDAETGATVWQADRQGSVSGNCGGAVFGDAVYVVDSAPGGQIVRRFDLATGLPVYDGPVMPGFLMQNSPMVGPDGRIYVNRCQNNAATDFFYAFEDDGVMIRELWNVPTAYSTSSQHAIGPDGSVYMLAPGYELVRLDPMGGTVIDTAGVQDGFSKPWMATDAEGRLYVSNGAFATGRLSVYTADLELLWDRAITNINIGGPALAADGSLVVCGNGTQMFVYEGGAAATCSGDVDGSGATDFLDLLALLGAWGACGGPPCPADLDADGLVGFDDLLLLLSDWNCPAG